MVKIICKDHKLSVCRCKKCDALLSYENEDIEKRESQCIVPGIITEIYYITCPACGLETIIYHI